MRQSASRPVSRLREDRPGQLDATTQTCESDFLDFAEVASADLTGFDYDDFVLVSELVPPSQPVLPIQQLPSAAASSCLSCALPSTRRPLSAVSTPAEASESRKQTRRRLPAPALLSEVEALPCTSVYIVWSVPGSLFGDISGIHYGAFSWLGIQSCIPGGAYRSGTDHLRSLRDACDSAESPCDRLQRAVCLYQSEARKHKVHPVPSLWLWSSHPRS
eukprot:6489732-Amphidinium_carterae.2